jgi:carboxylate-amine ligase
VRRTDVLHLIPVARGAGFGCGPSPSGFADGRAGYDARVEQRFSGPSYTLGVEEELMIVDAETLDLSNSIEGLLADLRDAGTQGEVKPELMESVCEIATTPCRNTSEVAEQLRSLRRTVQQVAAQRGLAIGSAGTHPFALWEDQRIVSRPRYRDLIAGLQFVARQEIIFGIHVHVGIDDADKAIHVTNGMRVHLPLLLALSANSPFWRGDQTGLDSTRTPIFRAFPRVGIPPRYDDFADWAARIDFMTGSRVIRDYTYLWYDVRPHPNFGTVEVRVMDSQTRVEHTVALTALIQAMVKELAEHYEAGTQLSRYPYEMLDENKWLAARHGLSGSLVDLPDIGRIPVPELTRRLLDRLAPHAEELGSTDDLECIEDILENGNGASRQAVVYEANHDLREVVGEIVAATVPEEADIPRE